MSISLVLINPPLTYQQRLGPFSRMGSHSPPFNLCYLAAVVRERHKVVIIDAEGEGLSHDDVLARVAKLSPDVVGVTATTVGFPSAIILCRMLKEKLPDAVMLFGGVHFSAIPERSMEECPKIDIGFVGEAERNLPRVLDLLEKRDNSIGPETKALLGDIPGLIFRRGEELFQTDPEPDMVDPNTLPPPAFDLLPPLTETYHPSTVKYLRLPSAIMLTARGCPFSCNFCVSTVLRDSYRPLSMERVAAYVDDLIARYGVRDLNVHDDTLTVNPERTLEFCALMKERGLSWSCQSRVDTVTPKLLAAMKDSGCWSVAYGVESGSQEVLENISKGITLEKIETAVRATAELGMDVVGFFMLGSPGETKKSLQQTIDLSLKLPFTYILPWCYTPFPGTAIFDDIDRHGYMVVGQWSNMSCWHPVFVPHNLTEDDLKKTARTMVRHFYLRPSYIYRYLKKSATRPYFWKKTLDGVLTFFDF